MKKSLMLRNSWERLCVRILILTMLLYMIIPASWIGAFFKRSPKGEEQFTITPSPEQFVPNIVHFIRFGKVEVTFIDAVCLLAALKNQKPQKLYIHTDQTNYKEVWGKYWNVVVDHATAQGVIEVKYLRMPKSVFGKGFYPEFAKHHASDVERLRVLIKYGGVYLDNDSYLVKSLEDFFSYEMTLGWEHGGGISDQVLIAKRNATFLRVWLESYKDYRREQWFYNAGQVPTEILKKHPELAFAVPNKLAEYKTIPGMLYYKDTNEWRTHYAIHLLINHQYMLLKNISSKATYPVKFNEENILNYPTTLRQMALDVYPFPEKINKSFKEVHLQPMTEGPRRGKKKRRSTRSLEKIPNEKTLQVR